MQVSERHYLSVTDDLFEVAAAFNPLRAAVEHGTGSHSVAVARGASGPRSSWGPCLTGNRIRDPTPLLGGYREIRRVQGDTERSAVYPLREGAMNTNLAGLCWNLTNS